MAVQCAHRLVLPLFMLAMPIAWLLYTATASYVHGGTR